jgi:hypothetical protein
VIRNAMYAIKDGSGQDVEAGACDMDGHELTFIYTPSLAGVYILIYEFDIGLEHIIKKEKYL